MFAKIFSRMASSSTSAFTNRLANEKSAYLLQHASNPVDWFSWGSEAFEKAKREDKPIFLSIGYSTCHWCHVMEHESFESPEIAALLNENFVNIKMDREERPDIDKQYMTFVQAMSGNGGWPASLWLTPDLRAVMAGTYFPPEDNPHYGRPGFKTVIRKFAEMWRSNRSKLEEQAKYLTDTLGSSSLDVLQGSNLPAVDSAKRLAANFQRRFDSHHGGFSQAPKFPQPSIFTFLFRYHIFSKISGETNYASATNALTTLEKMAQGGIFDHVGKGFHRYSTDNFWHVPHFEKMLYDQAQLAVSYAEAFLLTKDNKFARVLDGIVTYMLRDLHHPAGGFYCAEDADSYPSEDAKKKLEGAFYVWKYDEIDKLLKNQTAHGSSMRLMDLACKVFDIRLQGNVDPVQDPHGELTGQNVLIQRKSIDDYAKEFNLPEDVLLAEIDRVCNILAEARMTRPRPHRDEKFVTSWNGMAISGLSYAAMALQRPDLIDEAVKTATFVRNHMYSPSTGLLWRTCYVENTADENTKKITQLAEPIPAICLDYVCLIAGLLDLYEATLDVNWLDWAIQLQEKQNSLFWDEAEDRLSYFVSNNPQLLFKLKDEQDGAEPSSNSLSCMNLLRLADYFGRDEFRSGAEGILRTYSELISQMAVAVPCLMAAFLRYKSDVRHYAIGSDSQELLTIINSHFDPFRSLYRIDEAFFANKLPWLNELREKGKGQFVGTIVSKLKEEPQELKSKDEVDSFLRDLNL